MSALEGLFLDADAWAAASAGDDPVVYTVTSSPVPEVDRELPQSITTIMPGDTSGELWMTKGHQHPNHQGEIYLALKGRGGLLMFDGERTEWLDMLPGTIGYIPPGWAHRSVNTGDEPYAFLAVYPGGAATTTAGCSSTAWAPGRIARPRASTCAPIPLSLIHI